MGSDVVVGGFDEERSRVFVGSFDYLREGWSADESFSEAGVAVESSSERGFGVIEMEAVELVDANVSGELVDDFIEVCDVDASSKSMASIDTKFYW